MMLLASGPLCPSSSTRHPLLCLRSWGQGILSCPFPGRPSLNKLHFIPIYVWAEEGLTLEVCVRPREEDVDEKVPKVPWRREEATPKWVAAGWREWWGSRTRGRTS